MQGLNNGYEQLVGGRKKNGGGRDEAATYIINRLIYTTKSQHLQYSGIKQISQ